MNDRLLNSGTDTGFSASFDARRADLCQNYLKLMVKRCCINNFNSYADTCGIVIDEASTSGFYPCRRIFNISDSGSCHLYTSKFSSH